MYAAENLSEKYSNTVKEGLRQRSTVICPEITKLCVLISSLHVFGHDSILKKKELICESCIFLAFAEVRGGTLDLDSCESLYVCWELNLDPQQEQQVLLISELSLQLHDS